MRDLDTLFAALRRSPCRGCLQSWHGIASGRVLTADEQAHAVATIRRWLREQVGGRE